MTRCWICVLVAALVLLSSYLLFGGVGLLIVLIALTLLFCAAISETDLETQFMMGLIGVFLRVAWKALLGPVLHNFLYYKHALKSEVDIDRFVLVADQVRRQFYLRLNQANWLVFKLLPQDTSWTWESTVESFRKIEVSRVRIVADLQYSKPTGKMGCILSAFAFFVTMGLAKKFKLPDKIYWAPGLLHIAIIFMAVWSGKRPKRVARFDGTLCCRASRAMSGCFCALAPRGALAIVCPVTSTKPIAVIGR